jgi:hypothetical protein
LYKRHRNAVMGIVSGAPEHRPKRAKIGPTIHV